MFKKKKVVLESQGEIWYLHVNDSLSELESLCAQKTLQKKKIVKAANKIYSMSEFTPLVNHPGKTFYPSRMKPNLDLDQHKYL